jgi:bifunctional non-homologous end joining protein LigD
VLDGEAVWCGADGIPNFENLQSRGMDAEVCYFAFDLLELDGVDYRPLPLQDRKKALRKLLRRNRDIRYVEHFDNGGQEMFEHACKMGLEGIVSKRRDLPYRSGRSNGWLKTKNPKAPAMLRLVDELAS